MKKTILFLLSTVLLVLGMSMSLPVSAQEEASTDSITVTEVVDPRQEGTVPDLSFSFNLENAAAQEAGEYEGITGGLTMGPAAQSGLQETFELTAHADAFSHPGIYVYTLQEQKGETTGLYEGVDYSSTVYTLKVYVDNNGDGGYVIRGIAAYADGSSSKADKVVFRNTYTTQTMTLTKQVEGDQGNADTAFPFTVSVSGVEGQSWNVIQDGKTTAVLTDGQSASVQLKSGESVQLTGLTASDTYTVQETSANEDGYETRISSDIASDVIDLKAGTITSAGIKDNKITYTNSRNATVPTGMSQTLLPFLLIIAGALLFAGLLLKARKSAR